MNVFLCIVYYTFSLFSIVRANVSNDLWIELFETRTYNSRIRPNMDPSDITEVYVDLHLMAIHGLDEVSETLTTSAFISVYWFDEFLVWDPTNYDNLTIELWPQEDVWKPDLSMRNSAKGYVGLGNSDLYVENSYTGEMTWYMMEVFATTCNIDITYYPFDVQYCQLLLTSWSYPTYALSLENLNDGVILDNYIPSSQWEILSTDAGVGNNEKTEPVVYFSIVMKRKSQHHLMTLFLPIFLLAVLEVFVFALPSDGGEKSGYAVTVFLATAVFLTIVETTMPANSDKISIFSIFLTIQTVQSTVITIISLCLIRCSSFGDKRPVPQMLVSLATFPKQCCKLKRQMKQNKVNIQEKNIGTISRREGMDNRSEKDARETSSGEVKEADSFTWKMFADSMDTLCFIVFSSIFGVTTTVCFIILLTAPK